MHLKRESGSGELGPCLAPGGHRRPEYPRQGHRHQARSRIRPVVHILTQAESVSCALAAPPADQTDRIYLKQQRRGAPLCRGLWVEHVRCSRGHLERLNSRRILVQQVSEVRRWPARGGTLREVTVKPVLLRLAG